MKCGVSSCLHVCRPASTPSTRFRPSWMTLQITTPVMREAASLWAEARQQGVATADRRALHGDVILAAIARLLITDGHDVVVATTNIGHLARFVPAQLWHTIT